MGGLIGVDTSPVMAILVLGASGFVGLNAVEVMASAGLRVRCGYRSLPHARVLRKRGHDLVHADLSDAGSLGEAMRDCRVVVHAAGHYPRFSNDYEASLAVGLAETARVLDAAAAAGVEQLVYVSSTATGGPCSGASTESHRFTGRPGRGVYHDLKWAMEELVLAETRFRTLVMCPGACLGPWDRRIGTASLLVGVARGLLPPLPAGIVNLVDVRDVGRALHAVATASAEIPRRIVLVGSNHRLHDLLLDLSHHYGSAPPAAPIPAAEAIRMADASEAECAVTGGRPSISRELIDLIVHGAPIDASLAERTLGIHWTPLPDTLEAFDAWARRWRILPHLEKRYAV